MCSAEKDGIMLFGVRLSVVDNHPTSFRKSASMNNLSQYESPPPHDPSRNNLCSSSVHGTPNLFVTILNTLTKNLIN